MPTISVRHGPTDAWQTFVVFVVGVVAVRSAVTDPFGYAVWVAVFGPVAAMSVTNPLGRRCGSVIGLTALAIAVLVAPVWLGERPAAAGRMTLLITVWIAGVSSVASAVGRWLPGRTAFVGVSVMWLGWSIAPLVRADTCGTQWALALNPLIALNAASDQAGDWTHQTLAYRWLTTLGQDVVFDWPTRTLDSAAVYAGIAVAGTIAARVGQTNVPRGTLTG